MSQTFRSFAALGDYDAATRSVPVIASTRNPVRAPYVDADGNHAMRLESLESWDLARFTKNPIILAVHDQGSIAAIVGEARDVVETPRGLEMRIFLAAAHDAPEVVEIENKLKRKLLRGISVGFSYGVEEQRGTIDGLPYSSFTANELNEASFVPIPADADALVDTPEARAAAEGQRGLGCMDPPAEAQRKAALSAAGKALAEAAKALAAAQKEQPKLDAADVHQHFDRLASAGNIERTQVGGVRVPARLTRTGVLAYLLPDGKVSRQLRLPSEVFDAESLASLRSAPVVAREHHTPASGLVDASNFRERALGHVEEPHGAGQFIEGTLVVNDADTADAIERRDLADISCGYTCRHDETPGVYDGEPYDLIHRDIRYNHVAVLPPGKGRAGRDVSIQLDSNEAAVWCFDEGTEMATPNEQTKTLIKLDGADYEYGSASHIGKIETMHKAEIDGVRGQVTAITAERDTFKGKFDAAEAEVVKAKAEVEGAKSADGDKLKARIKGRVRLMLKALRLFGEDDSEEGDDKAEEKMDQFDGLSDREIMVQCLNKTEAFKEVKFDGESDDYVRGLFEHAMKSAKPADGIDSVVRSHQRLVKSDANDDDAVKAEIARQKKAAENPLWKRPLQMTKG